MASDPATYYEAYGDGLRQVAAGVRTAGPSDVAADSHVMLSDIGASEDSYKTPVRLSECNYRGIVLERCYQFRFGKCVRCGRKKEN